MLRVSWAVSGSDATCTVIGAWIRNSAAGTLARCAIPASTGVLASTLPSTTARLTSPSML